MNRPTLAIAALALLAGCTTADITLPTEHGIAKARFVRVWSDVSASANPDGTWTYSSEADAAAAASISSRLLDALLATQFGRLPERLEAPGP